MKRVKGFLMFISLICVTPALAIGPEDPIGKWSGTPPKGGTIEITITAVENGKISATAVIPGGGSRGARPSVSGEIDGDKVTLVTTFHPAGNSVTYLCTAKTPGEMSCITTSGKHTTTFRKVIN